jgi:hypothetical protein
LTTHLQLVPRSRQCRSIHTLPQTPSWRGAELVKYRGRYLCCFIMYTFLYPLCLATVMVWCYECSLSLIIRDNFINLSSFKCVHQNDMNFGLLCSFKHVHQDDMSFGLLLYLFCWLSVTLTQVVHKRIMISLFTCLFTSLSVVLMIPSMGIFTQTSYILRITGFLDSVNRLVS